MNWANIVLALVFVSSAADFRSGSHQSSNDNTLAVALLDEADNLSRSFRLQERANTLLDLAQAAATFNPEQSDRWSLELFEATRKMPLGQFRAAMQKNALRTLAVHDPRRALALYRALDLPARWQKPGEMVEDVRAFGPGTVFQPAWKTGGLSCLNEISKLARYLGGTGQYPYQVMADIAVDVAHDSKKARRILADATANFRRDPGFSTSNQQFVQFLIRTHRLADESLLRSELRAAVQAIRRDEGKAIHPPFIISVTTPLGDATFNSRNDFLLFRLMPLLSRHLPEEAQEVLQSHPEVRAAPRIEADTPVQSAAAVAPSGVVDKQRMQQALDEHRLMQVQNMAAVQSEQARAIADQIENPDLRAIAMVTLAAHFKGEPQSKVWIGEGVERYAITESGKMKVRLGGALVSAYAAEHATEQAQRFLNETFTLGESLFGKSMAANPELDAYLADGYDELTNLAKLAVKNGFEAQTIVARVRKVSDERLRAALLISTAAGLQTE